MMLGVWLANPGWLGLPKLLAEAIPITLCILFLFAARWMMRRQFALAQQWNRAIEAVQLQQWPLAWERLRGLLLRPALNQTVRTHGLLGLAAIADHHRDLESSELLYEYVLRCAAAQSLHRHTAAVGLAESKLKSQDITSGVNIIDRLNAQKLPDPFRAGVELVALFRDVSLGHSDAALDSEEQRCRLFRGYLGVRAGYGYALLALAHHRRGSTRRAAELWRDATLLIRPEKLVSRYELLVEVERVYPASGAMP
jgi:hypothetical protein